MSLTARPEAQMAAFRDGLMACELVDLGFSGIPYTYDNMQSCSTNVRVPLDHAVATNDWRNMYAYSFVQHLASPCSDHIPLLLRFMAEQEKLRTKVRRYEIFWECDA